ncbi:MAG: zinc dependent phospholipase C family protein [Eubacteriales bacterium]
MDLKSHIIIVNLIADILEKQIDIKIDRDTLEFGAVYPDINLPKRVRIHNTKQVYNNYQKQTNNLINKNKNKFGISFSLGMLCHYICDSFCWAHNMRMATFGDFKKHVKYEKSLAKHLDQYTISNDVSKVIIENIFRCTDFDIFDFLNEYKSEYLKKSSWDDIFNQHKIDTEFAIICSTIILMGFIYELEMAECSAVEVLHI